MCEDDSRGARRNGTARKSQAQAAAFERLMTMIAELRSLPLKEVEPAVLYSAEEAR